MQDKSDSAKNEQTKCQRFAKLKELQADTQANPFAAHLILPNRTTATRQHSAQLTLFFLTFAP